MDCCDAVNSGYSGGTLTACNLYSADTANTDARIGNEYLDDEVSTAWTWFANVEQSDLDAFVPAETPVEEEEEEPVEEETEEDEEEMSARTSSSALAAAAIGMLVM